MLDKKELTAKLTAELRADGSARLSGYVNAVERESRPIPYVRGSFIERVAQGAFERAIKRAGEKIEMRLNHGRTIGRSGENLTLREDAIGLHAEAIVTDEETVNAARTGRLTGWSFRFYVRPNGDEWTEIDGVEHRRLLDFDMDEVSVLTVTPAYTATSIELRDGEERISETRTLATELEAANLEAKPEPPGDEPTGALDVYRAEIECLKLKG